MNNHNPNQMKPRNGHTLVVVAVARISGCRNQKELSLDDQVDHAKQIIAELYDGPYDLQIVSTKGKGEWRDRPELTQIECLLRTREIDLVVCEDIGRVIRGADAVNLVGIAVDMGTRVVAPNDCIDTIDADWEEDVIQACRDHVGHNSHTSKRIKQKKMNRFKKFGGATPSEIATYVKPEGAKTFDDWYKQDEWTPGVQEGLRLLKETRNASRVADYFNSIGLPVGNHSRSRDGKWTGRMVRRYYKNRMLGGFPGRGFRHTVKHNERGRRISVVNPQGPTYIERPHLAHVDIAELDAVNALLDRTNGNRGRKKINGYDPRYQVPRKRTVFPSQHARCWYCGYQYVRGGNGILGDIMCTHSRDWGCWNSVGVDCSIAATKVMDALRQALYELDGFDAQFRHEVEQAHQRGAGISEGDWRKLERGEEKQMRDRQNIVDAIAEYGPSPEFKTKLNELDQVQQHLAVERRRLEDLTKRELQLPQSIAELRAVFERKSDGLAIESHEFGDLMRLLVPEFHIFLVRLVDGGHLMPRARAKLNLAGCVSDLLLVPSMSELLTRVVTLDLFEAPQRERIRVEAVRLESMGVEQREIANQLPEKTFQAVVHNALKLNRIMEGRNLTDPYEMLLEPPADYRKLRRHKHPRYEFKPIDGYDRPAI